MITFTNYADLIKERVSKIKDDNWEWKVKSISDNEVHIQWGYLGYLEEKNDYFILKLYSDDSCYSNEMVMSARTPDNQSIDCRVVSKTPDYCWQSTPEHAIIELVEEIAEYAHSRY